jgi:hypothetical protein
MVTEMAPAAMVIDAAVTEEASAPPNAYVPAVDALYVPKWVTAVDPAVENVNDEELVIAPAEAAFQEHACRM